MFSPFQVIAILDKLKDEKKVTGDEDDEFAEGRDDGVEWEGEDVDDEGIIYVK